MSWNYFSYETDPMLKCPCGQCDGGSMDDSFMRRLDALRGHLGFPLVVTSGYRCPDYNARISSTGYNGPHTTGQAVDLNVYGSNALHLIAEAYDRGFKGIGIKQHGPWKGRFVHLDALPEAVGRPRPWCWTYP